MMWKYLLMTLAVSAPIDAANAGSRELSGVWGGDRTVVTFSKTGAQVQSDCSEGTIAGPLRVNTAGKFKAKGVYQTSTGGPQRADEGVPAALYSGHLSGKTLVLTIQPSGGQPQTLTLREGVRPKLLRCL
jgi:hypothetical protein